MHTLLESFSLEEPSTPRWPGTVSRVRPTPLLSVFDAGTTSPLAPHLLDLTRWRVGARFVMPAAASPPPGVCVPPCPHPHLVVSARCWAGSGGAEVDVLEQPCEDVLLELGAAPDPVRGVDQ